MNAPIRIDIRIIHKDGEIPVQFGSNTPNIGPPRTITIHIAKITVRITNNFGSIKICLTDIVDRSILSASIQLQMFLLSSIEIES